MNPAGEFGSFGSRLRRGDEAAAEEVIDRFAGRLIALARSRLDQRLRGKVEADDVLQSVLRSFFVRQRQGQFKLEDWDSLWSLLVTITVRKCNRQLARYLAGKRDVQLEKPLGPADRDEPRDWTAAIDREPTPSEAATLAELIEQLMAGLNTLEQSVLAGRLQGYSVPEISEQVRRTERTVQRVLARVRERAARLQDSLAED